MPTDHPPKAQDFRIPANIPTKAHSVCQNTHSFCPRKSSWEGKVGGDTTCRHPSHPCPLAASLHEAASETICANQCQDCVQTTCSGTAPRIQEQRGAQHNTDSGQNSLQLSDIQKTMHVARNLLLASTAAVTGSETPFLQICNYAHSPANPPSLLQRTSFLGC